MFKRCVGRVRNPLIAAFTGLAIAGSLIAPTSVEARYRHHYKRHGTHSGGGQYAPAYAAMVVDANSGRTLYARDENELRHPASITKVMTLFLLFEQLEKGRMQLDSDIKVSAHAHSQQPTKLGLAIGETISVEDAIKAVVTRSANDIAVAIAEAIGGDEDSFAQLMTQKARALGMSRTVYANASGLPDDAQVTTARDLTVLGRAIQERFPKYYRYFSIHEFSYDGQTIRNHNHLLGRIEGMDGIKTGYTRSSGFNLLSSVKRDGHRIVSVVLGGKSGRARDQIMAQLIEANIDNAATSHTAPLIADASTGSHPVAVAEAVVPRPLERIRLEEPARTAAALVPKAAAPGAPLQLAAVNPQFERIRPAFVAGTPRIPVVDSALAPAAPVADLRKRNALDGSTNARTVVKTAQPVVLASATTPSALGWTAGPNGRKAIADKAIEDAAPVKAMPVARPALEGKTAKAESGKGDANKAEAAKADATKREPAKAATIVAQSDPADKTGSIHVGWMIQIGATDDVGKASELLARAKTQGRANLASARPYTEKVQKGDTTLYRARFAGLEPASAEAACKSLKKSGFDCFAAKN